MITVACSKNDNDSNDDQQQGGGMEEVEYSFNLLVSDDFLATNRTAKIYISNDEGEIILESNIIGGQSNIFSFNDAPNMNFDFSMNILYEIPNIAEIHQLTTINNFTFATYTLDRRDVADVITNISIEYYNVGDAGHDFYYGGSGGYSSTNGGTLTADSQVRQGHPFYTAYLNTADQFPRYLWVEEVNDDITIVDDYNTLPFATDLLRVIYPQNQKARFYVVGHKNINSPVLHSHVIRHDDRDSGALQIDTYLKDGLYDLYDIYGGYTIGNRRYNHKIISTDLNHSLSIPSFDFSMTTSSLNNFTATTTGSYSNYGISYSYTNEPDGISVSYGITGESSTEITSSKETLFNNIFQDNTLVSADDLEFRSFGLGKDNIYDTHQERIQDFFLTSIENPVIGDYSEGVYTNN